MKVTHKQVVKEETKQAKKKASRRFKGFSFVTKDFKTLKSLANIFNS